MLLVDYLASTVPDVMPDFIHTPEFVFPRWLCKGRLPPALIVVENPTSIEVLFVA
jgi:hypothetical protein